MNEAEALMLRRFSDITDRVGKGFGLGAKLEKNPR